MKLLQRAKTLLTGFAAVLLIASTTFAEPAFAKNSGIHHGGKFQSDFYFHWGHGKRGHGHPGHGKGAHQRSRNHFFFGSKNFGHRGHKFSRNYGHSKKHFFKKHHGFSRNRSFGRHRSFRRH